MDKWINSVRSVNKWLLHENSRNGNMVYGNGYLMDKYVIVIQIVTKWLWIVNLIVAPVRVKYGTPSRQVSEND